MEMTIEEIIEIEHKYLDDNESTFEMESLFDSFISVMEKYQKIEQIIDDWEHDVYPTSDDALDDIERAVVKDGNVD